MALDLALYRRTVSAFVGRHGKQLRRISVIDIHPAEATRTLVFLRDLSCGP